MRFNLAAMHRLGTGLCLAIGGATVLFAQGPLTPPGSPAPTMRSLQQVYDEVNALTTLSPTEKFSAFVDVPFPTSAGGVECTSLLILPGKLVKLESVAGATYYDPGSIAYLRYSVRTGTASSKILTYRFPLQSAIQEPVVDTRTFHAPLVMWVSGGVIINVGNGDIFGLSVCVQSSTGELAQGAFVLTGTYVTIPTARPAEEKEPSAPESNSGQNPTLQRR